MTKTDRSLLALPPLCVAGGLAIVIAHAWLSPRIVEQQRRAAEQIYFDALQLKPDSGIQLDSMQSSSDAALPGVRATQRIYIARSGDRIAGIVLPLTAHEGYAGDIELLLGVAVGGKVISVQVISHRETRGLGDKIEPPKSNWLEQFRGATFDEALKNRWRLRNEGGAFDGITGATVTSRAVVKAVQQGLAYFEKHREELLENTGHE